MITTQRDNIFSIMKGIAIVSVVVGHCSVASVEGFVNQYHLAAFYFIAGYFFNPSYLNTPKNFLVKRIKRLYVPFVEYGLIFLLLHNVFCLLGLYPADGSYSPSDFVRNGLKLVFGLVSYEPFMGAMWFAPSLLLVSIVYLAARKAWHGKIEGGGIFVLSLIGLVCIKTGVKNPYCIWNAMATAAIYHLGILYRKHQWLQRYCSTTVTIACIAFMVVVYHLGGFVHFQPSVMRDVNWLLFFIVPLAGVTMVYGVSKWISRTRFNRCVALCGDYSFEIMALHFVCFKIVAVAHVWCEGGNFGNLADFPVYEENLACWSPVYVVVGCAVPIMLFKFKNSIKNEVKSWYGRHRHRVV